MWPQGSRQELQFLQPLPAREEAPKFPLRSITLAQTRLFWKHRVGRGNVRLSWDRSVAEGKACPGTQDVLRGQVFSQLLLLPQEKKNKLSREV